jgi:FkbM family methyltransferase
MRFIEKFSTSVRYNALLVNRSWLWKIVRPIYNTIISICGVNGLERIINKTDKIKISPKYRAISERYEPTVWKMLMEQMRPGDVVVDVGANIGLYAIALAKRGAEVIAFEPDPVNFTALQKHVSLNRVKNEVRLFQTAVGQSDDFVYFEARGNSESHIKNTDASESQKIKCMSLDTVLAGEKIHILKIDVEGYEEKVLKGALNLLRDSNRSPRCIYIEVHPYAWNDIGTTSESILQILGECNYNEKCDKNDDYVDKINECGELIAYKNGALKFIKAENV